MSAVSLEKAMKKRPDYIIEKLGRNSKICLLNSHDIFKVLKDKRVIIMACNTRIGLVIPGIMRAAQDLDAVVAFELAKSEGDVDGGYTGQDPDTFFKTVIGYAEEVGFTKPFFIHGDHITVRDTSQKAIDSARRLIAAELQAGYTSFAIDASFNELEDNIEITTELAKPIVERDMGLEVEVGEIKLVSAGGELTTVEEATRFILELSKNGVHPDLLATNNGSKHGNYKPGEEPHIDLPRTGDIYNAIRPYGVCIAQHGITGTPLNIVGQFADYGIRKGNVGTEWQNIAHRHLPEDLMAQLKAWADEHGGEIKKATKPFKAQIDDIPQDNRKAIEEETYKTASEFIKAFRAEGTASIVCESL